MNVAYVLPGQGMQHVGVDVELAQFDQPVRWLDTMHVRVAAAVDTPIEFGAGRTPSRLARQPSEGVIAIPVDVTTARVAVASRGASKSASAMLRTADGSDAQ